MEQKNQLTKPFESSSEVNFLTKLFKEYPKIKSLKNFVPLEQAIARCMVLVGIPQENYPKGIEKEVLIDHIVKQYPYHVAPEIIKAFEMAITRSFSDVDYDLLLKHYGKFSPEFLSRIMSFYNEQIRSKVLALQANQTPLYKEPAFDLIASYEIGLFQKFDKFVADNTFLFTDFQCALYFNELRKFGLIQYTKSQLGEFGQQARTITPRKKPARITDKPESDEDYNRRIIKAGKSIAFETWIKEQALEQTDLRALIIPELNKVIQARNNEVKH